MLIHALLAAPLLVALDGSGRAVTERAAHASPRAWLEASPRGAYTVLRSERSRVAPPALRFHLARLRASLDALEPRGDARAADEAARAAAAESARLVAAALVAADGSAELMITLLWSREPREAAVRQHRHVGAVELLRGARPRRVQQSVQLGQRLAGVRLAGGPLVRPRRLEARLRRRGRGAPAAIAPQPPGLLAHGGLMALKTLYSLFRNHAEKI